MTDLTKHMTNDQRQIAAEAYANAEVRAIECFELALKSQIAGAIRLPAKNEAGESVLVGCLNRMYDIRNIYVRAGNAFLCCVPYNRSLEIERGFYDRGLNTHKS